MAHTRRLLVRLAQAATALAFVASVAGCWEDPGSYANAGTGGRIDAGGGSGGAGGMAGAGGDGGTGDATGTGGSAAGSGGSTGGSAAGSGGSGSGSAGGRGGSAPGGSAAGSGGSAAGSGGRPTAQPWPSSDAVVAVDAMGQFPKNLSDLVYQPAAGGESAVLWGILNDPPLLYCLLWNGTTWGAMTDDGWTYGKTLRYPSGTGSPDSEGVTRAEWSSTAIYVVSERDNSVGASRMSVLRYDHAAQGTTLTATHEWNLTPDLPTSPANAGLEGIAWIPDSYLVTNGLFDEAANAAYDPGRYSGHGAGLFFVGVESTGMIHGYALDHDTGTFTRITSAPSGLTGAMSLHFDRDQGNLWVHCDALCNNQDSVLRVSAGQLTPRYLYDRPATLPNSNVEGITIAPETECAGGRKSFFWSDDDDFGGHAIYRGSIPCGPLP